MSKQLVNDIKYVNSILNNKCNDKFRKIYTCTNENLSILFDKIDLTNKNVFTVLSSSDYLYMAYLSGAKKIDCFDINPLTYRYYYLRKWLLKNNIIDIGMLDMKNINNIINTVLCNSETSEYEKESLIFWKYVISKLIQLNCEKSLFIFNYNPFNCYYNNLEKLLSLISSSIPRFYNINLCHFTKIDTNVTYDYIFLSNIFDYYRKQENLEIVIKNLQPLIKENGSIVCSHIKQFVNEDLTKELELEKAIFSNQFEYLPFDSNDSIHYYQYIRKL